MGKRTSQIEAGCKQMVNAPDVLAFELTDDGVFPNSRLPLLLYRKAVSVAEPPKGSLSPSDGERATVRGSIH